MGYMTRFTLKCCEPSFQEHGRFILDSLKEAKDCVEAPENIKSRYKQEYIDAMYALDARRIEHLTDEVIETLGYYDEMKWYEHEDDMLALSRVFPDKTLVLEGVGEEQGDIWVKVFKDGKMLDSQKAVLVIPVFDLASMCITMQK